MTFLKFVFVFVVLAVSLRNVLAVSSEEKQKLHATTSVYIEECSAKFGVTTDEKKKMKESPGTLDPCIMACVFRKSNMIDDQGLYNALKAEEFIQKYLSDEADKTKASGIISKCKAVNMHKVTDGEKGCDRAKVLWKCFGPFQEMFAN